MPFLNTSKAYYSKSETVAGTSADPLDKANGYANPSPQKVRVRDLTIEVTPELDDENSKYLTGDYTGDESIVGKTPATITRSIKAAPAELDKANDPVFSHRLNYIEDLENVGLKHIHIYDTSEIISGNAYQTQHLFFPSTTAAADTITGTEVVKNENGVGIATEVIGQMSGFTISAEGTGKPLMMEFSGQGSVANDDTGVWEISAEDMENLVFDDANIMKTVASKFMDTTITITDLDTDESFSVCSASMSLDSGNTIAPIDCQASKSGVMNYLITAMAPRFMVSPQLKTLSDFNYWGGMIEQKKYSIDIKVEQSATNIYPFRIFIPNAQLLTSPRGDAEGLITQELTFRPLRNISKTVPADLGYYDAGTGVWTTWDATGSALDGKEAEAMWYFIVGEKEV